jgi:hypothetical protein
VTSARRCTNSQNAPTTTAKTTAKTRGSAVGTPRHLLHVSNMPAASGRRARRSEHLAGSGGAEAAEHLAVRRHAVRSNMKISCMVITSFSCR